ncbi:MAG: cob(I)yrinic acid a,c-diamide adenosyltransferase [Verrucomicrobiae bacterium]|nr:cob(I)yrinic acid a,c-diamide adenosyltransferase [Verrucomicrobiae bacterium]
MTRTGDDGTTGLVGGQRTGKHSLRIRAMGAVDELNATLGLARAQLTDALLADRVRQIQNDLFDLGAQLAAPPSQLKPGMPQISPEHIQRLEQWLTEWNQQLGPLTEFILPGGTPAAAHLHLARTVCRRAESECVALHQSEPLGPCVIPYLNRLSDLLFVMARQANRLAHHPETHWQKPPPPTR